MDSNLSLVDKIHRYGANTVSDAELISLFLAGHGNADSFDSARLALTTFGGIRPLMNAGRNELSKLHGFGSFRSAVFEVILELARRYMFEKNNVGDVISSPQVTKDYLALCLRDKPYESFFVLFLDSKHRVIHQGELFRGTIDSASVPVREVVKDALKHNSAACIIGHNHPSGEPTPSGADRSLTETLFLALGMVGVRLLDHIVVGDSESVSFAESGLLN